MTYNATSAMVKYSDATILFPEFWSSDCAGDFTPNEKGSIDGNKVSFTRGEFLVQTTISPWNIPSELADLDATRKLIIDPAISQVCQDLESIAHLVGVIGSDRNATLRKLVIDGVTTDTFFYERNHDGSRFKVYDYSKGARKKPFATLARLASLPIGVLREDLKELHPLGRHIRDVHDPRGTVPYVQGDSLIEATDRAIRIYGLIPILDSLVLD